MIRALSLCLLQVAVLSAHPCDEGAACTFLGKDLGWQVYQESAGPKPHPIKSDSWTRSDTSIFYSISSFRDELCPRTLFNAFTKAAHPHRIRIGVVQQNTVGDIDCLETYCEMMSKHRNITRSECPFENQISLNRQRAEDAMGPTWARALGSAMVGEEEFCMQTDSHMDFVRNWDKKLLEAWALTENEYAVLSTYVTAIEELSHVEEGQKGINNAHECPHLCMITFGSNQLVRNWGTKCIRNMAKPKLTNMVWGAGLSFSKCHAEKKTPYDPFTPGIFDGEEFNKAIRLWTYGYDIYSPHRVYIVHDYHKSQGNPKHSSWSGKIIPKELVLEGVLRLRTLSLLPDGYSDPAKIIALRRSKYGLGDRRSPEQAIRFSGFALNNRTMLGNRCGNLDHVPFTEHPLGPDYIPRFDPATFEPLDEPDIGSIYYKEHSLPRHPQSETGLQLSAFMSKTSIKETGAVEPNTRTKTVNNKRQPPSFRTQSEVVSLNPSPDGLFTVDLFNNLLHSLAFVSIFLCPVAVTLCCLGRCSNRAAVSFLLSSCRSCCSDGKVSGKFT